MIIPFVAIAVLGTGALLLSKLTKKPFTTAPAQGSVEPLPIPVSATPAVPTAEVNPGALPLDADGFPTQATREFAKENNIQARVFGPILEETRAPAPTRTAPVVVGPAKDVFIPGTPEADNSGRVADGTSVDMTESEPAGFIDSLFG